VRLCEGLETFPPELLDLAPTLRILDLSGNRLSHLPLDLPRLENLEILFCSGNRFEHLPEVLGDCLNLEMVGFKSNRIRTVDPTSLPKRLRWLILTDNQVDSLPETLGDRPRLQKLMLAGNRLCSLPESLRDHGALELLRIAANRLDHIPDWLFSLPKLAWLATSGNPGSFRGKSSTQPPIPWNAVSVGDLLGQGASGETFRATWEHRPIALKLFKGATTSDGTPDDEMETCLAAGTHPHLPGVLGRIEGHPEGRHGLAMELLPEGSTVLGNPPDFRSCTRDTYPAHLRFSPEEIRQVASAVALACAHLAAKGISHGDLYAHNILVSGARTYLTDFGAANRWDATDSLERARWYALEARAFGCLLDDLAERCGGAPPDSLRQLRDACLDPHPGHRPRVEDWRIE